MDTNVIDLATHYDQHHWLGQALWRTRLARTSSMMNTGLDKHYGEQDWLGQGLCTP